MQEDESSCPGWSFSGPNIRITVGNKWLLLGGSVQEGMYNSKPTTDVWSMDLKQTSDPKWTKEAFDMPPGDNFVGAGNGKNTIYLANNDAIYTASF